MSWWSWGNNRSKEQIIKDRQDRVKYYNQGTYTSGPDAGRHVAEVAGQPLPGGISISEVLGKLNSAVQQSYPINYFIPTLPQGVFTGDLSGALPIGALGKGGLHIVPEKSGLKEFDEDKVKQGSVNVEEEREEENSEDEQEKEKREDSEKRERLLRQFELQEKYREEPKQSVVKEGIQRKEVVEVIPRVLDNKIINVEGWEKALGNNNSIQKELTEEGTEGGGGVQLKKSFSVGGTEDPMLGWLSQMAPQVLTALAAGAGGQLAAVAAKKIVGDAIPGEEPILKQQNYLGLTVSDIMALQDASSRLQMAGQPVTSSAALAAGSQDPVALGMGRTIPAQDQGMVQTISDAAILMNNQGVPNMLQKNTPLISALAMSAKQANMEAKLLGNQEYVLSPPNMTGAQVISDPAAPRPPQASFGYQLQKIGGEVRDTLSGVTKAATVDAATDVAGQILSAAGPGISALTKAAGNRLGGWFARGIGGIVRSMMPKIVGDDPMPGTTGRVKKIVGDPPLMDGSEHGVAAAAMNSDTTVTLLAARMIMEQLLSTMAPIPLSGSKVDVFRAILNASNPDMSLYNNEPLDTEAERSGMTLWPQYLIYWNQNQPAHWDKIAQYPVIARVGVVSPEQSVPLTETPTAASVAPMLVGAPITEYSGALRIKTMRTDMDQLMTVLGRAIPELLSDKGYSFARPMAVLLGLATNYAMPYGTEATELVSGIAYKVTANEPTIGNKPFYILNQGMEWQAPFAWVTLREYVEALNGYARGDQGAGVMGPWNENFLPDQWDSNCAIIPIFREEMTDGQGNLIRVLSAIESPFLVATYPIQWMRLGADGYVNEDGGGLPADKRAHTNFSMTQIEGPSKAVLFVVVDMPGRKSGVVNLGFANEMTLDTDVGPANPNVYNDRFIAAVSGAMGTTIFLEELTNQIQRLERVAVTASDRASAMRLISDTCLRYGQPKTFVRSDPGVLDVVGGMQAACQPGDCGLPEMYQMQASMMFVSTRDRQITTPSGRLLQDWNGVDNPGNIQVTHRIAHYSSLLHICLMRGLVQLEEERSQQPLAVLPAVCEVMYEMGVLTAAVTDRILQENSQTVRDWIGPPDADFAIRNTLRLLNQRNVVRPQLAAAWMAGIQYPAAVVVYDQMENITRRVDWVESFPGMTGNSPFARVTRVGLNRYFAGMVPHTPVINLHCLTQLSPPQYRQIRANLGAEGRVYMNEFWSHEGQSPIHDEFFKLSFSAIPDMNHLNPSIRRCERGNYDESYMMAWPITPPDASWSRALTYSPFNNGVVDMRSECSSIPMGALMPQYFVDRGAECSYLIKGYSDMFRMQGGSAAIRILTSSNSAAGLVNAELFPMEFNHLYNTPGSVLRM